MDLLISALSSFLFEIFSEEKTVIKRIFVALFDVDGALCVVVVASAFGCSVSLVSMLGAEGEGRQYSLWLGGLAFGPWESGLKTRLRNTWQE